MRMRPTDIYETKAGTDAGFLPEKLDGLARA
jgi:hypothetical protein